MHLLLCLKVMGGKVSTFVSLPVLPSVCLQKGEGVAGLPDGVTGQCSVASIIGVAAQSDLEVCLLRESGRSECERKQRGELGNKHLGAATMVSGGG